MLHLTVQDVFGRHYRVHTSAGMAPARLRPQRLSDSVFTKQFLQNLSVPAGYWRQLLATLGEDEAFNHSPHDSVEDHVCRLVKAGRIQFFDITDFRAAINDASRRTFKSQGDTRVQVLPASARMAMSNQTLKSFTSLQAARDYLEKLGADDEQLKAMVADLPAKTRPSPTMTPLDRAAQSLVNGDLVVSETQTRSRKPEESGGEAANDEAEVAAAGVNSAEEMPPETTPVVTQTSEESEKEPICKLNSLTVSAKKGREALVNAKSKTTPTLAVVATEKHKKGLKRVTAKIEAEDLCGQHKAQSNYRINKPHTLKSKSAEQVELDVGCDPWRLDNAFERVWLPSVRPKTYNIAVEGVTCNAPDIEVKSVDVAVYPDMTWHWKTNINFGTLEFIPGKAQVKYSDLAIDGNVQLTYDGE